VKNTAKSKKSSTRFPALKRTVFVALAMLAGCAHSPVAPPHAIAVAHRRAAPAWGEAAKRDLRSAVAQALAPAVALSYDWSCAVVAQDGTLLYSDRSAHAVVPASTQKLIVGAVTLAQFNSGYRFHTHFASALPPRKGVIAGDFWLVGSGDPSLRSDDVRRGVEKLRAAGIRAIEGGVAVDASVLAGPELNPYWNPGDANEDFMAPTSGVSIDEDTVEFRIAGTSTGLPAGVRVKPRSRTVSFFGSIASGSADDVTIAAMGTPGVFRLSGTIPPGRHHTFYLPVHDIPHYAGVVLLGFLRDAGISVARGSQAAKVPRNAQTLWDHPSPALTQLVHHMMIFSDNHFAEQFLRTLGAARGRADDAHGLAAERAVLKNEGIPAPGLRLVDGSGLADANRVAAITLVRLLAHSDADERGNALYPLLARGGLDGTLKRYHFSQASGRVRAKSGHLASVSALAGYVNTRHHGRVAFAFLFNGVRDAADPAVVAAIDSIARR
jgi:D-alanyl-D-alanine carboxypeptidase/D-alanyl-D-alanine-endopeptidase (penicillin-binding protein 4)